ncbi:hypothetical protein [Janibacter indicus]|uniref:hypothetical protein n=1 Tax=Janibacter indicus TaxID=857417 RepID=UPI003D9A9CF3
MSEATPDLLSLGCGGLEQPPQRVLEGWQKAGAAHAPVLTRCSCCGHLLDENLPDHWEALVASAKAWRAARDDAGIRVHPHALGIHEGSVPRAMREHKISELDQTEAMLRERSLIYVAATPARDVLAVTWSGKRSP